MQRTKIEYHEGAKHLSSHGYVKVYIGRNHPLADSRGYAYEHRLVAAKQMGRSLLTIEKVHHRDQNKENNDPSNFKVANGNAEHYFLHGRKHDERRKPGEPNEEIECQCGCRVTFLKFDNDGRPRRYISGHNPRRSNGRHL